MKKIFAFIIFTFIFQFSYAALSVQVDERSELLSIVCRLAGYQEYVNNNLKSYVDDIDSYFAPYATLPLIDYAKEIRKDHIAYDAVADLIPYMEVKNKKILFTQEAFKEITEEDSRWSVDILSKYAVLLNDFYKKTNFNRFFNNHTSLYEITKVSFNETITNKLNLSWFDNTFGVSNTNFHIVLNLCNGRNNYGPSNGKNDYYSIIGVDLADSLGIPSFDTGIIKYIIHEFSHSYCNPLCNKYTDEILPVFDTIFPYVTEALAKRAYGSPHTLMYENLTRLSTLMYLKENKSIRVADVIEDEQSGFLWMRDLYFFYDNFINNRDVYPDFESFIPEYISFMKEISDQINKVMSEYENKIPRIVSVFPMNGSKVSSKIKEARILFNVPMWLASGFRTLDENPENREMFIQPSKPPFERSISLNRRIIIIPIHLEEKTKYGCTILTRFFQSEEGYYATGVDEWKFDTE